MGIFPKFRGENKKYLSCHHLESILAVYSTYTALIFPAFFSGLYATYHLLWELETTIDLLPLASIYNSLRCQAGLVRSRALVWSYPP